MIITNKIVVPHKLTPVLNSMLPYCIEEVKKMLADRSKRSSKYYKSIPSAVAKSLIVKYQKNKKCKAVKNYVIPICGDKGRVVKLLIEPSYSVRIPALFKKETIDIHPLKPISGFIRFVEFFRRAGVWYMSYCYDTPVEIPNEGSTGYVGVDRNARGNVATLADLETGKVKRLGPDVLPWKQRLKNRKAKLQRRGAKRLLKKINRKQSNRTKDINHKVSKLIVDYAAVNKKRVVLENLGKIKNSKKCGRYVQKSNWSFFQLETFIKYKCLLRGVPVIYVDPQNTSKMCSRCGSINDVSGKKFACKDCGHTDHRDSNAGFNIALKGKNLLGHTGNASELPAGYIDVPQTGKGEFLDV